MRVLRFFSVCALATFATTGCAADDATDDEGADAAPIAVLPDAAPPAPAPDGAPPPPPPPNHQYGEPCASAGECASGICVAGACSVLCTLDVPNDCRDVDAFCVPLENGAFACYGEVDTGSDEDDAILHVGDSLTRNLSPLGDADLFLVYAPIGTSHISANPATDTDVQLEVYNVIGEAFGILNTGAGGATEAGVITMGAAGWYFAVVRDIGPTTGAYTIAITP